MSGVPHLPNLGPYVSAPGASTSQAQLQNVMYTAVSSSESELTDLAAGLKNKAQTTKDLSPRQMAAYEKQMLAAVKDIKPLLQSESDKLTVAAVVPGALGKLQPSGTDLTTDTQASHMMQLQLQDAMNKQAQAIQTVSAIMKMMHDTGKAIINNIKA